MAVVYLAFDPYMDRRVAVKVLLKDRSYDDSLRSRFKRESRMVASLNHPAIVPVYDFGEEDEQPYLVMRYMEGGSLRERLREAPLTLPEVATILSHIAPALTPPIRTISSIATSNHPTFCLTAKEKRTWQTLAWPSLRRARTPL